MKFLRWIWEKVCGWFGPRPEIRLRTVMVEELPDRRIAWTRKPYTWRGSMGTSGSSPCYVRVVVVKPCK